MTAFTLPIFELIVSTFICMGLKNQHDSARHAEPMTSFLKIGHSLLGKRRILY